MINKKSSEEVVFGRGNDTVTDKRTVVQPAIQSNSIELESHLAKSRLGDQNSIVFLINYYCNRSDHASALTFYRLLNRYDENILKKYFYSFTKVPLSKAMMNYLIDLIVKGSKEASSLLRNLAIEQKLNFLTHSDKKQLFSILFGQNISYFNEQYADVLFVDGEYEKAKELYEQIIDNGSLISYKNIADIYYYHAKEKNYEKAFECYSLCNTVSALYCLGKMFEYGHGVKKNLDDAYNCYMDCVANGLDDAKVNLIAILLNQTEKFYNPKQAFDFAVQTADRSMTSNFYLGYCYLKGIGTSADNRKAFTYLLRASASKVPIHLEYLADCYLLGIGIVKDVQKALDIYAKLPINKLLNSKLFRCYNELGDDAMAFTYLNKIVEEDASDDVQLVTLAKYYLKGEVVEVNRDKACSYLKLAIENGNDDALYLLAQEYLQGGVEENKKQALVWFEELAEKDLYDAIDFLFNYYKNSNKDLAYKYAVQLEKYQDPAVIEYLAKNSLAVNADEINLVEAFKFNKKLADSGDKSVHRLMGDFYFQGLSVDRNLDEAFSYYNSAADENDADALYAIGNIHENGVDVEKDYAKAYKYYVEAVKQGSVDAQLALANFNERGIYVPMNLEAAFEIYRQLSIVNGYATYKVGEFLENGRGCSKNCAKAIVEYTKALEQGEFYSAIKLAKLYEEGLGVKKDLSKAFNYYKQIASHNCEAQLNIAKYYHQGLHVKKDLGEAIKFYELACINNPEAKKILGDIYFSDELGFTDYTKAVRFYESALTSRGHNTFFGLGNCYYSGLGVPQNYSKAFNMYFIAKRYGDINGEYGLGKCYYYGNGTVQNYDEAFKCFLSAAESGIIDSYSQLGECYEYGYGVEKDILKAIEYYKICVDKSIEAKFKLGEMYLDGIHCDKDVVLGLKYLNETADVHHIGALLKLANYYKSEGSNKSLAKAFTYFKSAALGGSIEGKKEFGLAYYFGSGISKNQKQAIDIFRDDLFKNDSQIQYYIGTYTKSTNTSVDEIKSAIDCLEFAASNEYRDAIFDLANLYFDGVIVNQDLEKSFYYYSKLKDETDKDVLFRLAYFYNKGISCKRDRKKAFEIYEKLSGEGDVDSANSLGELYYNKGEYDKAFEIFNSIASSNEKGAIYNLALCYLYGHGTTVDTKNALKKLESLAKSGYHHALNKIGEIYFEGELYKQNYAKAIKYFNQAEENGSEKALINLANCYLRGYGVSIDSKEAYNIYVKGCEKNYSEAINKLGEMHEAGNSVFQDLEKAYTYYVQSSDLGNDIASKNLGKMYYRGIFVEKDIKKAYDYFVESHENNVVEATAYLALCYFNGDNVDVNYFKAFELFNLSKEFPMSVNKIGECYEMGYGVDKDLTLAFKCYNEVSEVYVDARFNLARMYENESNMELSLKNYEKAAAFGHSGAKEALQRLKNK